MHDLLESLASLADLLWLKSGVNEEHQCGFAKFSGYRQPFGRSPSSVVEGFFEVDLRADAAVAGHSPAINGIHDSIAVPALFSA